MCLNFIITIYIAAYNPHPSLFQVYGWRYWLAACSLPGLITICICMWIPESPQFDLLKGHKTKALATLKYIAEKNKATLPKGELALANNNRIEKSGSFSDLFSEGNLHITAFTSMCFFAVSFCFYGSMIFTPVVLSRFEADAEFSDENHPLSIIHPPNVTVSSAHAQRDNINVSQISRYDHQCLEVEQCVAFNPDDYSNTIYTVFAVVPMACFMFLFINKINKHFTLTFCYITYGISCLLVTITPSVSIATLLLSICRATINSLYLVLFVYTAEVFPTHIRAFGVGISDSVGRLGTMLTPLGAQLLLAYSFYLAVCVYAAIAIFAGIMTLIYYPKKKVT